MAQIRYSKYYYKPRKKKRKLFLAIFLLLLVGGGIFYSIFFLNIYTLYSRIIDSYRILFNDYSFLRKISSRVIITSLFIRECPISRDAPIMPGF